MNSRLWCKLAVDKTFCTLVRLGLSHSGLETSWQPVVEKGKIRFSQQVGERLLGSTGSCKIKLVGYTVQHRQHSCDCFGQITAATCLQPTANYSLSSDANRKRTCSPSKQKLCLLCWFRCWSPMFTLEVKTLSFRFLLHFFKFHYYSMNIKQVFAGRFLSY